MFAAPWRISLFGSICVLVLGLVAISMDGCADNPQSDPTTRALSDPMGYSPRFQDPDISGGGISDFHSDSFKKDMDHVLNP
jgi:hypothetical protein